MTRRRWIADSYDETTATLMGEQAAHLARVLRATPGMVFDVVAGGFLHRAEVTSVAPDAVVFALHEKLDAEAALPVTILLSIFKFDPMEWAIEKATELGVARIIPVIARRSEKHLAHAAEKRVERWRRIVREAAQQSRRSDVPEIAEPMNLKAAIAEIAEGKKILLDETEMQRSISDSLRGVAGPVAFAFGPEGGWAPEERSLLIDAGWEPVTLGPRILRAETAATAVMAIAAELLD
jgi:16S rRNA (uracil1498-N3)-methyltransferase